MCVGGGPPLIGEGPEAPRSGVQGHLAKVEVGFEPKYNLRSRFQISAYTLNSESFAWQDRVQQ